MAPRKKKAADNRFKVFGFMDTPHTFLIVAENGIKIDRLHVESEVEAKTLFTDEIRHNLILDKIEEIAFQTVFVSDPPSNEALVEACRLMELDKSPESEDAEKTGEDDVGVVSVRTKGTVFSFVEDGVVHSWTPTPEDSRVGLPCSFYEVGKEPNDVVWYVSSQCEQVSEERPEEGAFVFVTSSEPTAPAHEPEAPVQTGDKPDYPATGTLKVVQVPCEITPQLEQVFEAIRRVKNIEAEASMSAAAFREDIKAARKALMDMEDGRIYTSMECEVLNDWEGGERHFINPKTGRVVLKEPIPDNERQLEARLDISEDGEGEPTCYTDGPDDIEEVDSSEAAEIGPECNPDEGVEPELPVVEGDY